MGTGWGNHHDSPMVSRLALLQGSLQWEKEGKSQTTPDCRQEIEVRLRDLMKGKTRQRCVSWKGSRRMNFDYLQ